MWLIFYMFNPLVSHPQGETLLRLADVCRKLETEQEKVLPFYTSSLNAEELSQEKAHAMEAMSEIAQVKYTFSQITSVIIVLSLTPHTQVTSNDHTMNDVQNTANLSV